MSGSVNIMVQVAETGPSGSDVDIFSSSAMLNKTSPSELQQSGMNNGRVISKSKQNKQLSPYFRTKCGEVMVQRVRISSHIDSTLVKHKPRYSQLEGHWPKAT